MGQEQSVERVADPSRPTTSTSPSTDNSERPSLDSLIAEAAAYGDGDESESLAEKAQKALDCPCIAHLRSGPCGVRFSEAFICFLKSTAEEKGSDCVHPFVALQNCIKANPDAFPEDVLEDKDVKEDGKPGPEYNIRPPLWAVDSETPSQ
ncbi:Oxidoreductase [Orobanche hederae]